MKIAVALLILSLIGVQANPLERMYHGLEGGVVPYHAHIWIYDTADNSWPGSGVIITSTHILTVAVNIVNYQHWDVGYGSNQTSSLQFVRSQKALVHENFDDSSLDNNIGLIVLPEAIIFSQLVKSIMLPTIIDVIPMAEEIGDIAGFSYMSDYGPITNNLQHGSQHVISMDECVAFFPYLKSVQNHHFCATDNDFNVCGGAQGAGFVVTRSKKSILAGIVSFGNLWSGCASHAPPVYIKISEYLDWINLKTGQ